MMKMVKLPACEHSVFDGGSPTYESACGEPASYKFSWDDGKTWLHLCQQHAEKVEAAQDEEDAPCTPPT